MKTITPDDAKAILNDSIYGKNGDLQRKLKPARLQLISQWIESDTYQSGITPIELFKCGNDSHIINGQHRLVAVANGDKPIKENIIRSYGSDKQLRERYSAYDNSAASRTQHEIYKAFDWAKEYEDYDYVFGKAGVTVNQLSKIVAGAKFVLSNMGRTGEASQYNSYYSQKKLIDFIMPLYCDYYLDISSNDGRDKTIVNKLRGRGFVGTAAITYKYQPEKAAIFWGNVSADDRLRTGQPEKAFNKFLLVSNSISGSNPKKNTYNAATYGNAAAFYWNKFMAEQEIIKGINSRSLYRKAHPGLRGCNTEQFKEDLLSLIGVV